jgi:hypothetical protein
VVKLVRAVFAGELLHSDSFLTAETSHNATLEVGLSFTQRLHFSIMLELSRRIFNE